jgi:hypothetical protein
MMTLRMSQSSAPNSLRRFFDRVVHRSFGDLALGDDAAADYLSDLLTRFARTETLPVRERELRRHIGDYALFRPEHGTPDLPFFRRLVTEW